MQVKIMTTAATNLKTGDRIYLSENEGWLKKIALKIAFWHEPKPTEYRITEVQNTRG